MSRKPEADQLQLQLKGEARPTLKIAQEGQLLSTIGPESLIDSLELAWNVLGAQTEAAVREIREAEEDLRRRRYETQVLSQKSEVAFQLKHDLEQILTKFQDQLRQIITKIKNSEVGYWEKTTFKDAFTSENTSLERALYNRLGPSLYNHPRVVAEIERIIADVLREADIASTEELYKIIDAIQPDSY